MPDRDSDSGLPAVPANLSQGEIQAMLDKARAEGIAQTEAAHAAQREEEKKEERWLKMEDKIAGYVEKIGELTETVGTLKVQVEENRESGVTRGEALEAVAAGYADVASAQVDLENEQLSPATKSKVRNSGIVYGAGASGALIAILETIKAMF